MPRSKAAAPAEISVLDEAVAASPQPADPPPGEVSPVLSAGILTVPGREHYVEQLQAQLGPEQLARYQVKVYSDDAGAGVYANAKRAWLDIPPNTTHRMIFESDIIACRDILFAMEQIVTRCWREAYINTQRNSRRMKTAYDDGRHFIRHDHPAGQGACMPNGWVREAIAWADSLPADSIDKQLCELLPKRRGDYGMDGLMTRWLLRHRRMAWVTVPGLVWHVGWGDSQAFDRPAFTPDPTYYSFLGVDKSALEIAWDNQLWRYT